MPRQLASGDVDRTAEISTITVDAQVESGAVTAGGAASPTTSEPQSQSQAPKRRVTRACAICNRRKIRCCFPEGASKCGNCLAFDYECVPHERKRKRYALVEDDSPTQRKVVTIPAQDNGRVKETTASEQPRPPSLTPQDNLDFVQSALVAQFGPVHTGDNSIHVSTSPASNPSTTAAPEHFSVTSAGAVGYLGRSQYVGGELLDQEDATPKATAHVPHSYLTDDDIKVLQLRHAFDLPSRATCESLITTFLNKCDPWMPVLPTPTLLALQHGRVSDIPLILLQAILMAGSRMQTERSPLDDVTAQELYNRCKVLFFMGFEKDPMVLIASATILQYWNPTGPALISIHSSSYWLRIAVGLVHQIGLHKEPDRQLSDWQVRRRIFWTLFSRDCLLSMGQGRPRAIHLEDCSVSWPTPADFPITDTPVAKKRSQLFIAHVKISGILGDLTQWSLRGERDSETQKARFEGELITWLRELPLELRICDEQGNMMPYDTDTRFLMLPYLTAISILHKPKLPSRTGGNGPQPTMASAIASSFVARIFEDALARNEVRNGVAMVAIYLLIAGISLLTLYEYPLLWRLTKPELQIIMMSLEELSKTWQTANETLRVLQRLHDAISAFPKSADPQSFRADDLNWGLFHPFGQSFSSKIQTLVSNLESNPMFIDKSEETVVGGAVDHTTSIQLMFAGPGFSSHPIENMLPGSSTVEPRDLNTSNGTGVDMSPQALMDNVLQDLLANSHFSGEDWFFQNG